MSERVAFRVPLIIRFYRCIWHIWKKRRFQRFRQTLSPHPTDILLDIGGYPFNWFNHGDMIGRVDVLNLELEPVVDTPEGAPEIHALSGDARKLKVADRTYHIVFSNSVIEHVGSLEDQRAFAGEARRVGRSLWIQTPAKTCPIEPHYLGLFIHWFPSRWHIWLARWTSIRGLSCAASRAELDAIARSTRLLTKREMQSLFPDCEIWTERMFGFIPKSYVAVRHREDTASEP